MASALLPPLAISLGDPAGIGPEVVAKCWDNRSAFGLPPFVAVGDMRSLEMVWDGPIEPIDDLRNAEATLATLEPDLDREVAASLRGRIARARDNLERLASWGSPVSREHGAEKPPFWSNFVDHPSAGEGSGDRAS